MLLSSWSLFLLALGWKTYLLCGRISHSKSEGSKYQVCEKGYEGKFLLATRFFTGRVLSMEVMARTFKLLWHTKKGFEVHDMGDHRLLFVFSDEFDVEKVLAGEPWSFDW